MVGKEFTNYYHFKDGLCVALVFVSTVGGTNEGAAKKAMLNAYRRSPSDIKEFRPRPMPGANYVTFDGRNCH